ncbi:MAG: hypothetical protein JNG88_17060, partial [Phycisphaerales bacterium]|nr:hypothetical protein [Phycisphaerales bacterium]
MLRRLCLSLIAVCLVAHMAHAQETAPIPQDARPAGEARVVRVTAEGYNRDDAIKQALGPDGVTKMMVGKPKIGDAKCSYNISEAGPLIDLMNQILKKNVT